MQQLLLLLFMLYVSAIMVRFVKESAGESAAGLKRKRQNQQSSPQQSDDNSYLADLPIFLSKLVFFEAIPVLSRKSSERNPESPVTVPLRCNGDWKYATAVLRIVDDTAKEIPLGMTEFEAGRAQLIDIYLALQIQDFSHSARFAEALCADITASTGFTEPIIYLKIWLRIFDYAYKNCGDYNTFFGFLLIKYTNFRNYFGASRTQIFIPDNFWLDLFQALRVRDPAWYLLMKDLQSIGETQNLSLGWLYDRASPFIRAIIRLLQERGCGLIIPHEYFWKKNHLADRFAEIIDIVRCVSDGDGAIYANHVLKSDYKTRLELENRAYPDYWNTRMPLSIRIMKNQRLFVGVGCGWSKKEILKHIKTFLTKSADQVTDLFLNIYLGKETFWEDSISDSTDLISELATLPLKTVWIYSGAARPHFVEETKRQLGRLKLLKAMHNAQVTVWKHKPLTEDEVSDAGISKPKPCSSCSDRNQLCFRDWWDHIEKYTCKPAYILPRCFEKALHGELFMLAGLTPTNDAMPMEIRGGESLPAD